MCTQVKEKTKVFYLLLHIIRKCLATSPEAGLQHISWLLQKANVVNNKCLHFLLFVAFMYELHHMVRNIALVNLGLVSYPKIFPTSAHR